MRNLLKIINESYRVIEFGTTKASIKNQFKSTDKTLTISKNKSGENPTNNGILRLEEKDFLLAIKKNSSDIIILNDAGWKELKTIRNTFNAVLIYERVSIFNILFVFYFLFKGILTRRYKYNGVYYVKNDHRIAIYLGIKKLRFPRKGARHYLTPNINLVEFFKGLNAQNLRYCILRWFENLPYVEANEDIDILVEDDDIEKIHGLIDEKPGIIPFDIYSKSGLPGSDYNFLPYYVYSLADDVLNNTILFKKLYKVPTWELYFYLLAYHVVFHKGEKSGIISRNYKLNLNNNPEHDYISHLKEIQKKTNITFEDFTLEGLHAFLDDQGYAPPLDTLYKLSLNNRYLKSFLHDHYNRTNLINQYEGLVCFVVREKIVESGLLNDLKRYIGKEGFTIIKTEKLKEVIKNNFIKHVRGGNWNKGPWPTNGGFPSVIIVALDVYPVPPDPEDHAEHPGLTNTRIRRKEMIRDFLNSRLPSKDYWCNGIHSSDNEIQAVEYLNLAGLSTEDILKDINKYKEQFKSKYPVIRTLSRYSRRAKVELIEYNGKKAVLKTFKPNCDRFLANEIEAYNVFKEFDEIPKLLEMGDNYFVTSYINGSVPLRNKISIKTLKKCLNLLRKIYDMGYSLLDFTPANILIDMKKNIYLIDFEYLHKYKDKPSFLDSFDLIGFPNSIDFLFRPDIDIQPGEKLFNKKWAQFTGVSYADLSKLGEFGTYIKSNFQFYKLRMKKLVSLITKESERIFKVIHKAIP